MIGISDPPLAFPFVEAPPFASVIEVSPGILWVRFPLPFRLDHVNIYLIEDGDGWAVVDTGIGNDVTRAIWEALIAGPLSGKKLTRLIVTHFHPDHIGLAGWLCERFGVSLQTSQTTYLSCLNISLSPGALNAKPYHDFYSRHGMDAKTAAVVASDGHRYLQMVSALPPTFIRLVDGDTLSIGGRELHVIAANGHAPEQLMLYCRSENIFFSADQVIAKISPNISVWAVDPQGDPLGLFLRSLRTISDRVPDDALVLAGHQLPFRGLHTRCNQLLAHHQDRCSLIEDACRRHPHSVAELVPVLFWRPLDPHQLGFAFSETLAHVNYLLKSSILVRHGEKDESYRFTAAKT